jgi:chromosome segregation ATPase
LFIYTDGVSGCACAHLLQELAVKVTAQDQELSTVRKDVALLLSELGQTKHILNGISKELTESLSSKKKCEKKRAIIREQINIRKKVLNQAIKLPFTHNGRQRPISHLVEELSHVIEANSDKAASSESSSEYSAESLVGREILHRFNVEGEEKWYAGHVVSYNAVTHLHEVAYEGEEENCFF